jgi:amino acid adenylation domain-containing protein
MQTSRRCLLRFIAKKFFRKIDMDSQNKQREDFAELLTEAEEQLERRAEPSGPNVLTREQQALLMLRRRKMALQRQGPAQAKPGIPRQEWQGMAPLSFAQQRLWFLHQLDSQSPAYNISLAKRFQGPLNVAAMHAALNELLARHDVMRGSFENFGGNLVMRIGQTIPAHYPMVDLSELQPWEPAAQKLAWKEFSRPFDLSHGPLFRVTLLRLSNDDHILLVTMHHIVCDAWSLTILFREFSILYQAFCAGRPSPLPELPIQYADFADWQRKWLVGEVLNSQLSYWRLQLQSISATELPHDKLRKSHSGSSGAVFSFTLPAALLARLKTTCRLNSATPFMVLLAGFKALLHRYTGLEQITVGTVVANRNRAEIENVVGFFVNTLVLKTEVSENLTFSELLARVRKVTLEAYDHQDIPFEKLVQELLPERDLKRTPLFQILFSYQSAAPRSEDSSELRLGEFDLEDYGADQLPVKFDLGLRFVETQQDLACVVSYSSDIFEEQSILQLVRRFEVLLDAASMNSSLQIGRLPILADQERQVLLSWNRKEAERPARCLHEWFEEAAANSAHSIAVVCGEDQISYGELNRRANRLAHYLRERGVGPETIVGLCCSRSAEMIVGLLGILKAGGAYVGLDPALPQERLSFLMEDSGVGILITQASLLKKLPMHRAKVVVCLDSDWDRIALAPAENPAVLLSPENLAQVIYTSGSTGRPKGVAGTHQNVFSYVQAMFPVLKPFHSCTFAMLHNLSVDAPITFLWASLCTGGCLHILVDDGLADPAALCAYFVRHKIDYFKVAPSYLQVLLAANSRDIIPEHLLLVGGEMSHWGLVRRVLSLNRECAYVNHYGPTETTCGVATYQALDESGLADGQGVPIGRPLSNSSLYTTDKNLELVPMGVAGDLLIGGEGLARGYLNRPAETAERFIPDPFSHAAGMRLYRSGDMTRWLGDGHLEFLGRRDTQVKIRGYRIELGEVDVVMVQHPDVVEAVTVMHDEGNGDPRLVVYLVSRGESKPASEWRSYLRSRLPEWMVPSLFVSMEKLPRTPQGKIHHAALPAPVVNEAPGNDGEQSAVTTVTEDLIGNIWCALLNQERIGVDENFFELGGHSLLATQVITRVREAFRVELPLRTLFENPTVAGLAGQVEKARGRNEAVAVATMVRASRERELPLSFAQQRLWFIDQLEPGSTVYNIPFGVRLSGELNREALLWSLGEIVRRHEVLRTRFPEREGVPVQEIREEWRPEIEEIDLRGLSEREEEARRQAQEEADDPFDLGRGPLLRVKLLRLEEQEHVLLVTVHHIVSDGWSRSVMVREMTALYQAYQEGRPSPLGEMELQYADYAVWQREWLQGEVMAEQLGYWRRQLAGIEALELPVDHARKGLGKQDGGVVEWELSEELSQELKELSRREGATLFMTLLAVFQLLLSRHSGQKDVAVGTPIAGRRWQETEGMIGFFVNTLVLRSEIEGRVGFRELLKQVRETTLQAYEHQDVPFEKLVEELQPERDLTQTPLFQVSFTLQNAPGAALELPRLKLSAMSGGTAQEKFELSLVVAEWDERIRGSLGYRTALFEESSIRRLLSHFQNLLTEIAGGSQKPVFELPMLSETEQTQVLTEWNQAQKKYPLDKGLHDLFEEQVRKTPEAVAVVYEESHLTYEELNRSANQLARYLKKKQVGPEVRVGLCLKRSVEMIVGLLGILKAGGAYVPLDPEYPAERLKFMLEESQAAALLTQEEILQKTGLSFHGQVVLWRQEWAAIQQQSGEDLASCVDPENLAYLIYTSGSSGRPKAVGIRHGSAVVLVRWSQEAFSEEETAGLMASTSICFDLSVFEIFVPLSRGGRVLVVDNLLRLGEMLGRETVTLVNTVPSAMAELVGMEAIPASVRVVALAGEPLSRTLVTQIYDQATVERVFNLYGPSEDTTYSTFEWMNQDERDEAVSIGRPIANTSIYVLNENYELAPVGVTGELYLGGDGLARGYLNRPGMTAEKFIPDGFSAERGKRLYRTGDLARWSANGKLEFLGRKDGQVKLRGYRIELGEIESVLSRHAAVREAVVAVYGQGGGNEDRKLIAYVVKMDPESTPTRELQEHLRQWLPEYMVPSVFHWLDRLPRTPGGKIDRRALPAPTAHSLHRHGEALPPRDSLEAHLKQIYEDMMSIAKLGIRDDIFRMGAHSLLAVAIAVRLSRSYGKIPVRAIFENPTIEFMAAYLRKGGRLSPPSSLVPIQPKGSRCPLYCVHPAGGLANSYVSMAEHLGPDQPLYAFQSCGLEENQSPLTRIEDMASVYIADMKSVQSQGPYQIAGLSMGAVVAFEMARQLSEAGESVALVAALDGGPVSSPIEFFSSGWEREMAEWEQEFILEQGINDLGMEREALEKLDGQARLEAYLECAKQVDRIPADITIDQVRRFVQVFGINTRALRSYKPGLYSGKVTLFRTELREGADNALGWNRFALGGVDINVMPGTHANFVTGANLALFAEQLKRSMENVHSLAAVNRI